MLIIDCIRTMAPTVYLIDLALKMAFLKHARFINEHVYQMYLSFLWARPIMIWLYHTFKLVGQG